MTCVRRRQSLSKSKITKHVLKRKKKKQLTKKKRKKKKMTMTMKTMMN